MVAVISGSGLGIFGSSVASLGGIGGTGGAAPGRGNDRVYVNTATGNVIIQAQDERLSALGLDLNLVRTYNSQGRLDDDNGDNWRLGVHQRLYNLTGFINSVGSRITKVFGDGREVTYEYNAARDAYVSSEGADAHDTLTYSNGEWTWKEGTTLVTETYDADGRLTRSQDADNNTVWYRYTGSRLTSMDDASGQETRFEYTGDNLTAIHVISNGVTQTLTTYAYDDADRLIEVRVDLSPTIANDALSYTTAYTYDGASHRIALISQSDGTSVQFEYQQVEGEYRVHTYTDAEGRVTTFDYTQPTGSGGSSGVPATANANAAALSTTRLVSYSLNTPALTQATGAWQAAALLETVNVHAATPQVVFDQFGNGFAVWAQGNDIVARRYTASTATWSTSVTLDSNTNNAYVPTLAVDRATGNAVVAWVQSDGTTNSLYACSYNAVTNSWDTVQLLESAAGAVLAGPDGLSASMAGGSAVVAWIQNDGTANSVYMARLTNGSWTSPTPLESTNETAGWPRVAVDAKGNAMLLWRQFSGGEYRIHSRHWNNSTQSLSALELLDADGDRHPRVAFDAAGNAFAVWGGGTQVRRFDVATGQWSPQISLQNGTGDASGADLSVDAVGNALIAWVESDGTALSVYARRFDVSSGTWSPAALLETLSTAASTDHFLSASLVGDEGVVAWVHNGASVKEAYAARLSNGVWGAATLLETRSDAVGDISCAVDVYGNATVVWVQPDGFARSIYQVQYVGPYYVVPSGATWQFVANTLYGVNSPEAGSALQAALGSPTLTAGLQLQFVPATLAVSTSVPPYYVVQAADTWTSIAALLYGTSNLDAAAALQTALGNPTLVAGLKLTVPIVLNYSSSVGGTGSYLQTEVTANGAVTRYEHDRAGRLVAVTIAPDSLALRTTYEYDADGNVTAIIRDPEGLNRVTRMSYDNNGNLLSQRDDLGNSLERTYDANNQLLTEAVYAVRDPDGAGSGTATVPQTTRHSYDSEQHLRFTVSPTGRVTEHRYNDTGERKTTFTYIGALYTGSSFDTASLASWAAAQDKAQLQRVDYAYDFRGNLQSLTAFNTTDSTTGEGIGTPSVTRFVYDQRGQLLQTVEARGSTTDASNINVPYATTYSYDGLGRVLSVSQWNATGDVSTTLTAYDDANRATRVTLANGLVTTSLYNLGGELVSVLNGTAATPASLGTTLYTNDVNGRLRIQTDPTGVHQFFEYDAAGRRLAQIDGDGTLTEYIYDDLGRVIKTVVYGTRVDGTTLASLVDNNQQRTSVGLATIRAAADDTPGADRITRSVYDAAGLLIYQIDATGAVTQYFYDGAGRVTDEVLFATKVAIDRSVDQVLDGSFTLMPSEDDRRTRHFYDADGLRRGTLDAAGYLVELIYDAAGRLVHQVGYANPTASNLRSNGTLDQLRASAGFDEETSVDPERDIHSYFFYDGRGRRIGVLDAEGYLTQTDYDANGNVARTIRYNRALTYTAGTSTFASLQAAAQAATVVHTTSHQYDGVGRVVEEADYHGTITRYRYNSVGQLISTTRAADTNDARVVQVRYDFLGRVMQELSAEGYSQITAGMSQAQIDDIWNRYGVSYAYDLAGRRISATSRPNDAQANTTLYFYDADGRLRFEVNALGEVQELRYDALGLLRERIAYSGRISTAGLTPGVINSLLTSRVVAATDSSRDALTVFTYDLMGRATSTTVKNAVSSAADSVTTYAYDAFGDQRVRIESIDANRSLRTEYTYDKHGQIEVTRWDPLGLNTSEHREYDAFGRLVRVTDPRLNETRTEYDRLGRAIATIDALDNRRTTTYDAFSRVLRTRDALNNETAYSYDDAGRSSSMTTPENVVVTTSFNQHGQVLRVVASGKETVYAYDANGALKSVSDNLGALESRTYDRVGRQITQTDARGIVTRFDYDAANRVLTKVVDSGTGGLAVTTTYQYDGQGRVSRVVDSNGSVTETEYDRSSRVTRMTVDPSGLNIQTRYEYDRTGHVITLIQGEGDTLGSVRRTQYIYDTLGRRSEEIVDPIALGGTQDIRTKYKYDENGNLTRKIDAENNSTWFVYDAANRLEYTIDALGGVTKSSYDAEGRIVAKTRYATAIGTASFEDVVSTVTPSTSDSDRVQRSIYDRDGREIYTIDAAGGVTKRTYDDRGNVVRTQAYAIAVQPRDYTRAALEAEFAASVDDRLQWTAYDVRNRATFLIDSVGAVIENAYDDAGNIASTTAYAQLWPDYALNQPENVGTWAHQTGVASDSRNRTTRHWYDGAGRRVFTLDAENYLKEVRYNDAERTTTEIMYANPVTVPTTATTQNLRNRSWGVVIPADATRDQTTVTLRDAAGRIVRVTDALGRYEAFEYDDNDNKISYRNQEGAVWTYEYDANGRLTYERSPAVQITGVVLSAGSLAIDPASGAASIVTRLQYDALGNVRYRTEAFGTNQARTTEYQYDHLGRQTKVIFPPMYVYSSAAGDSALGNGDIIARTETLETLYSEVAYDTLGNAFRSRDIAGSYTYKTYDRLGRVEYEVDAERYVTKYSYDTFGNKQTLTRHAERLSSDLPNDTAILSAATVQQRVVGQPDKDRTIIQQYDRLNRLTRVTQPSVFNYLPSASAGGATFQSGAVTSHEYNAFGQIVRSRQLINPATNSYADTYSYFDRRGLKTAQVDALNYLTEYSYDESGDLKRQIEYARPLPSAPTMQGYTSPAITNHTTLPNSAAGYDRETRFVYDGLNRLVQETKVDVEYTPANSSTSAFADQVTTYGYDAVGNRTRVTQHYSDAAGQPAQNATYTYYDVLGRVVAVAEPSRDAGGGNVLVPLTVMYRDAYGNLVGETRYGGGAAGTVNETATPTAATSSRPDRTTLLLLDKYGRALQTQDGMGANRYASYNSRGEVAKEWQRVTNDGTTGWLVNLYRYDKLGHQVSIIEPHRYDGANTVSIERNSTYNAFGEVTARGIVDGSVTSGRQEFFDYDRAGRLWRTNAEDGVTKVYLHDLVGNVTAQIRSQGRDLASSIYADAAAVAALTSDVMRTETRYDLLGREVEQRLPTFAVNDGIEPINETFDIANGVSGPANPNAIYRLMSIDYGAGPMSIYVVDPTATLAEGGGYYINEQGLYVRDPNHLILSSVRITWAAPSDASIEALFEYRGQGSNDPNAWARVPVGMLANNKLGVDVSSLMGQTYAYRVTYRRRTETAAYAQATGTFRVDGTSSSSLSIAVTPTDPAATIPALNATYTGGVMSWAAPADTSVQATVRVRASGEFQAVSAQRQGNNFVANLSQALSQTGSYTYEIIYTRQVNGSPVIVAKNSGTLYSSGTTYPRVISGTQHSDTTYIAPLDAVPTPTAQGSVIGAVIVDSEVSNTAAPSQPWGGSQPFKPRIDWGGGNTVNLTWDSVGTGPVQVEIDYISQPARELYWNGQDNAWDIRDLAPISVTKTFAATATGASLAWSTADGTERGGGIERITSVRVRRQNSSGVWTTVLEQTNPAPVQGRGLTWNRPSGADSWQLVPVFEYAPHGSTNYATLPIVASTSTYSVDIDPLGAGNFDYRITYKIGGRPTAQQTGTLNITNGSSSTQWQVTVTPTFVAQPAAAVGAVFGLPGGADAVISNFGSARDEVKQLNNGREQYRWAGNNSVTLSYETLGQDFRVEIQYDKQYEQESPPPIYTHAPATIYSGSANPTSLTVEWDGGTNWKYDNLEAGGLSRVIRVQLIGLDGTILRDTAVVANGARVRWPDPHPANGATFEYWNGSAWTSLQVFRAFGQITVDVGSLNGTYQYRIRHYRYGGGEDFAASVATGTFTVSNDVATVNSQNNVLTAELPGVNANGSRVRWSQSAAPGDSVIFEYFNGSWHSVPAQYDGSSYYFDFASFTATSYEYRVKYYHAGAPDPYLWARGTASVATSTTTQPAQVILTALSNVTFPSQRITNVQLNGDTLSWNHPRESTGVVRLTYVVNGTQYSVDISGSGPSFQYTLSNVPAGQHFITYRIDYLRAQQTDAYAEASGSVLMTVSYPAVPPNITLQSQVPEYPSGVQQIAAPTQSGNNALTWGPLTDPTDEVIFRYGPVSGGAWTELVEQRLAQGYQVDLTPVAANAAGITYAYEILYKHSGATNPYAGTAGTFTLTRSANVTGMMINPASPTAPALVERTPSQSRTVDRWGNAIAVTDTANNTTKYRYGHLNQLLVKEGPQVSVVSTNADVNGDGVGDGQVSEQRQAPISRNFYDLLGRLIGTQDANGNVNRLELNAAGQTLVERHADDGVRTLRYDVFGAMISTVSEMGYETRYVYDGVGRLASVTREVDTDSFETNNAGKLITDSYAYDEAGRRISETNGENETIRYYYDLQDNLIRRRTHLNANTHYEYDAQGNKVREQDAIGGVMTWSYDYFNRLGRHADLGGVEYVYSYGGNFAGLLQSQTSNAQQAMAFSYDAAGQLTRINDTGVGRVVDYSYDFAGRRSREKVRINGLTYQDTSIKYDELNRIRGLSDLRYDLTYSYDAQGNRTHIAATYYDHERQQRTEDLWYTYDKMNRVLISQGVNNFGQVEIKQTQGTRLAYDAGGRRISSVTYGQLKIFEEEKDIFYPDRGEDIYTHTYRFITDVDGVTERYVYDGLDRLRETWREGSHHYVFRGQSGPTTDRTDPREYLISARTYDRASREKTEASLAIEGTQSVDRIRTSAYDADGRLASQLTQKQSDNAGYRNESSIVYSVDAANVVRSYDVKVFRTDGTEDYTTNYLNSYRSGESYQDAGQSVYSQSAHGGQVPGSGTTSRVYNVNGELISTTDNRAPANNRYFANGANGQALLAVQGNVSDMNQAFANALSRADNGNRSQYFFFCHGQAIGSFGQLQNESGRFEANFDVNYTPVSAEYPSSAPASVVAQSGDTLRIIAARVFGDSALWYLLAEANGLTDPHAAITEGTVIKVPNEVVSLSNAAGSFKPFDVSQAIGDTSPTQPLPPPPKKKGCGVVGQILVIVVAIVVAYFTAGAAASAMGGIAGSTSGASVAGFGALTTSQAVAAGAIGAAAGSVASQGVAIGLGMQESFSWTSVAASALTAGILQGSGADSLFGSDASFGQAVLRGAVSSSINQGVNITLGLQKSFSWREIAISGLSSAVASEAWQQAGGASAAQESGWSWAKTGANVAASVSSALVRRAVGGRMDSDAVLADVFGNAIGNSIVASMAPTPMANGLAQGRSTTSEQSFAGDASEGPAGSLSGNGMTRAGAILTPDEQRQADAIEEFEITAQRLAPDGLPILGGVTVTAPRWNDQQNAMYDGLLLNGYSSHFAARMIDHNPAAAIVASGIRGPNVVTRTMQSWTQGVSNWALSQHDKGYAMYERGDYLGATEAAFGTFGTDFAAHVANGGLGLVALASDTHAQVNLFRGIGSAIENPIGAVSSAWDAFSTLDAREKQFAIIDLVTGARGLKLDLPVGSVGSVADAMRGLNVRSPFVSVSAGEIGWFGTKGLQNPLVPNIYSSDFVGPVKWEYFYRGDSSLRSEFLSSMAQGRGVADTEGFLNSLSGGAQADILAEHGIASAASPFVSTSRNREVAEYFARGPQQTQNGYVTTFRIEAREAAALQGRGLIVPNTENPMSFFEPNPFIGLPESEYLFRNFIDSRYIYQQTPVKPR